MSQLFDSRDTQKSGEGLDSGGNRAVDMFFAARSDIFLVAQHQCSEI